MTENKISDNGNLAFALYNEMSEYFYYNYIWRNNTANGEEVNYYYGESNIAIEKHLVAPNVTNLGKITLIDCANIDVGDSTLSNNVKGHGAFLWKSNNTNLTNITTQNNWYGIGLDDHSSGNNIAELNTASQNTGMYFHDNSTNNTITDSNITSIDYHGMEIASSAHNNIINTTIASTRASGDSQYGLYAHRAHYTNLTNVTITSASSHSALISISDNLTISDSSIIANNTGAYCTNTNHTDIINTTIRGEDGIYMSESHWGNLTNNTINATLRGIFLTKSRDYNLIKNNITNYTATGLLLEEHSTNTTMIGNDFTRNGAEFDVRINDSNDATITNNESTAANYTFYLTNDTRVCTLDSVFNKTDVGYEDTSNLTVMWRIDVLCWDKYHLEPVWANLTVRYGDFSDVGDVIVWGESEIPLSNHGRLSGNDFDFYGPPDSSSNWLPVVEYKENVTGQITHQPMNCTAINRWDKIEGRNTTHRNITTTITGPGVTILVETGYTPNGKCYYCHRDKLVFKNTLHWTNYSSEVFDDLDEPYTPGRCIDCHDENDSSAIPHGNASGKDLLYQQSPQLCYTGKTGGLGCHSENATQPRLRQETEFNQTTHHPLGDGKIACKACHDNHGTDLRYDLLRTYTNETTGGYDSNYYALCLVCHLEEKLVAKMTDETDSHLQNYTNQTNFRDEYYFTMEMFSAGGTGGTPNPTNIHSPQDNDRHPSHNCYSCHNPHGSSKPAMTRYESKYGGGGSNNVINYTYITNVSPPNNISWKELDQANWNNSTMNRGGGVYLPDGSDGCSMCHKTGTESLQNDSFTYRTYIDYEPTGGAGCLECHDNNESAYNETPIRPIVNLTAVKLAMHTNLSGAFRNGSILQGTDKNFTEWLQYRGYTSEQIGNISRDNAICWACHSTNGTPPSPYFHPDRALNPYKCAKCHGPIDGQPSHTQGLVAAIDNHGPTTKGAESILIQTDVGKGGSCDDCHASSVLSDVEIGNLEVWKLKSGGWTTYTGRTTTGDVSHYGLSKTQNLVDTTNCLFCHCNETNGAIWGNATNISGDMYGADTTNVSECYTYCHVRPDWVGSVNESTLTHFHNESLYAGGGPNCVLCHDVDSEYGVQSLVNATAIANGIHGNILNNTLLYEGYGLDNRSTPCWGCHQSDGTIPEGMGDRNGITDLDDSGVIETDEMPYTCEDCHARSDAWNSSTSEGYTWESASDPILGLNKLPPVITEHYPNATLVKTNVHSNNGRCVDCHNNSIDQDHGDTAYKELGHTVFSAVSHYGTTSELLTPTNKCRYCHNDTTNATLYGNATQNKHGNSTDEANSVDGCYHCHANDQTPDDLHKMNVESITGGPDCLTCHGVEGGATRHRIDETVYASAMNHSKMNDADTQNDTNRSCWVCHFPEGTGVEEHSNRLDPAYHCYDCHNKNSIPIFSNVSNAPQVHNHFKNGTNISAHWTRPADSDSCMGCHNQTEMFYAFDENEITPYYTNFSITSHYGNNRTDIVAIYNPANSTAYCAYCHQNTSTVFMEYENDKNIQHEGTKRCDECHGTGRLHKETLTRAYSSGNCTDCHALYGANRISVYEINVTAVNAGVHADLNENMTSIAESEVGDANNSKCWGCHVPNGAYPERGHEDTFNNYAYLCYECHNGTYAYQNVSNAPAVYNHFKSGVNITARTTADTNSESCGYGCHNLSTMKIAGFDAGGNATYRVNLSQSSHYPRSRPDIATTSNLSDCTWCHRNSTNEFIEIFERSGPPNYTENIPHASQLSSCIISECHDRGRIHDKNLTIPAITWAEECDSCHYGLEDSDAKKYYVNETMFNSSVHASLNCTDCHINTTCDHPTEEYTWKWCECCHSHQNDFLNETGRHNVTETPRSSVLMITNCTTCHAESGYNSAIGNYNSSAEQECRWCHVLPDKIFPEGVFV